MMEIFVAKIEGSYRGYDRAYGPTSHDAKKHTKWLIDKYLEFVTAEVKHEDEYSIEEVFNKAREYYYALKECGFECEVIACDTTPIDKLFDLELYLLGIDIISDCESMLKNFPSEFPVNKLNKYHLFNSISDFENSKEMFPKWLLQFEPCYVYRLNWPEADCRDRDDGNEGKQMKNHGIWRFLSLIPKHWGKTVFYFTLLPDSGTDDFLTVRAIETD